MQRVDETGKSVQPKVHFRTALTDSLLARQDFSRVGKHGGLFVYLFFVRSRSCFLPRLPEAALPAVICSGRFSLFSGLVPHSLIDPPGRPPPPRFRAPNYGPKHVKLFFSPRTEGLFWQSFFSAISGTERGVRPLQTSSPRASPPATVWRVRNPRQGILAGQSKLPQISPACEGREPCLLVRQGTGSGGGCLQPSTLSTGMGRPRPT